MREGGVHELGDPHPLNPSLTARITVDPSIRQIPSAVAQGAYLTADENHTRFVGRANLVIVVRPSIARDEAVATVLGVLLGRCHGCARMTLAGRPCKSAQWADAQSKVGHVRRCNATSVLGSGYMRRLAVPRLAYHDPRRRVEKDFDMECRCTHQGSRT